MPVAPPLLTGTSVLTGADPVAPVAPRGSLATHADITGILGAPPRAARTPRPPFVVVDASADRRLRRCHERLRRRAFVREQGLFAHDDHDAADDHGDTRVLVALDGDGDVLGGVRLHPEGGDAGLGWWRGSRLVATDGARALRGRVGAALVQAACAMATDVGALRFDAHVQPVHERFFARLGWARAGEVEVSGARHVAMRWPIDRIARLAERTKLPLGALLRGVLPGGAFLGDDAAPVAGSDLVTCVDAILPAMVAGDPEWAGWCGMLVTAHDVAAMGAAPVAALDALGAPDEATAARVIDGLRRGAAAFDLPILGGHTTLGAEPSLSVTGLGRTAEPVPASGGRVGDALTLTADLEGGWRPGYAHRQWDSTSRRRRDELRPMLDAVATTRPHAAKDVSMAGVVGTAGMLAEASGTGAVLDVADVPRPAAAGAGDWLTCFPGMAFLTADEPGRAVAPAGAAVSRACGELTAEPGVRLRWPDGVETTHLPAGVTDLGAAVDRRGPRSPCTDPEDPR